MAFKYSKSVDRKRIRQRKIKGKKMGKGEIMRIFTGNGMRRFSPHSSKFKDVNASQFEIRDSRLKT